MQYKIYQPDTRSLRTVEASSILQATKKNLKPIGPIRIDWELAILTADCEDATYYVVQEDSPEFVGLGAD